MDVEQVRQAAERWRKAELENDRDYFRTGKGPDDANTLADAYLEALAAPPVAADIAEGRDQFGGLNPGSKQPWRHGYTGNFRELCEAYGKACAAISQFEDDASVPLDVHIAELVSELARLRAVMPEEVREAAALILKTGLKDDLAVLRARDLLARYIASIAEPAAGKQLADIHYNPSTIHDGPP